PGWAGRRGTAGARSASPSRTGARVRTTSSRRSRRSVQRDPRRRPVRQDDAADDVGARKRPPVARGARAGAVVAEPVVAARRNPDAPVREGPSLLDVRLSQQQAVDEDAALLLLESLAGHADDALDEHTAGAAHLGRARRRVKGDDVAPARVRPEVL